MIIVRLAGGLGNQMFQYAAGFRLASAHRTTLKLDLTFLRDRSPSETHVFRDFDLEIFGFDTPIASEADIGRFRPVRGADKRTLINRVCGRILGRRWFREDRLTFNSSVLALGKHTYLEGFFQNERYFADVSDLIRRRFRLSPNESALPTATRQLADQIRQQGCICLNIRRGDYVTLPHANRFHGVCSIDYYRRALEELRSRGAIGRVMVFSDDHPWAREHFSDPDLFTVVGEEHAGARYAVKFWLMTLCSHFVIPNSSFGWWAAWLCQNEAKLVARPAQWFQAPEAADVDICPASWIKVANTP